MSHKETHDVGSDDDDDDILKITMMYYKAQWE